MKLDGITGQLYPAYTPTGTMMDTPRVHTDGTIFSVEYYNFLGTFVNGVDPTTGTVKFSVQMRASGDGVGIDEVFTDLWTPSIIAGDGYAYWPYLDEVFDGTVWQSHLMLLRVNRVELPIISTSKTGRAVRRSVGP
jgi:hypothetical protein